MFLFAKNQIFFYFCGMNNQYTYKNYFTPFIKNFFKVELSVDNRKKLATMINNNIIQKQIVLGRKLNDNELLTYKKTYMHIAGELILEQHLKLSGLVKIDMGEKNTSFTQELNKKNKVNIITFEYGLFPMVYKKSYNKTIFISMINKNEFYICGIATPHVINTNSKSALIISEYYRTIGKSAFYGFERLTPITQNLGEFIKLIE